MIEIDGSQGEGGGQVLRTSLALSILTGQAIRLVNVRAGRRNPGLAAQHMASLLAAAAICDAEVDGAYVGSRQIVFKPRDPAAPGRYTFDVTRLSGRGSAGAVTLLLQAILLPLALANGPSKLTLRGGTHVAWSPPAHYVQWVLLPTLACLGLEAHLDHVRWGWYPEGGGEVRVDIAGGAKLHGVDLTKRGEFAGLEGLAVASNLPSHIPQRIASRANNVLKKAGLPSAVEPLRTGGQSTGAGIFMGVRYANVRVGFSALGKEGKPSEEVADEGAGALVAYHQSGAALGPHLPDQILPALALAAGPSALTTQEITLHTLTNIAVIGHFIERQIVVEGAEGEPGTIRVEGDRPGPL